MIFAIKHVKPASQCDSGVQRTCTAPSHALKQAFQCLKHEWLLYSEQNCSVWSGWGSVQQSLN